MIRLLICTVGVMAISFSSVAQKIPLINAAQIIERGKELYDSGKYKEAANLYLTIPKRDTAYLDMLTELALTYTASEAYDSAIAICEEALKSTSANRSHLLRSRAIATDNKGDFEKSIVLFNQAIEEYPFDYSLLYNLGITYYNHKDYDKARDYFFKTLKLNPFHAGSHLNLGRLAAAQGKKTHAMLSLGLYMGVNNQANQWLVFLEKFVSNEYEEEGSIPFTGKNAFEKLDQIIKSKIALDKNYKSSVDFDANLVKQYQILFEQLATANTAVDDLWAAFYLPLYTSLKDQQLIEPFLYHILSSVKGDQIKKWQKKNEKILGTFYTVTNTTLRKGREVLTVPASFGFNKPVSAWYDDDNRLDGLGNKNVDGVRNGPWFYFYSNGQRSAEGSYDEKGIKTGLWKFYRNNGTIKSIEDYKTGEVTTYYQTFARNQHFYTKDDKTEGDVEIYYPCGALKEKLGYHEDKRDGPGHAYYSNGTMKSSYQFANDKLTGEYIQYFADGQVQTKSVYKEGLVEGDYIAYHDNGKIKMIGAYLNDNVNGAWKYYHFNGKLDKVGMFKEGKATGEWTFYDTRGQLLGKRTLLDSEINGDDITYHNGKIHFIDTYKNGLLVNVTYLDTLGNKLGSYGNEKGNFSVKQFYPTGQLQGEGSYVKGKLSGAWKFYFREGSKKSEFTYVDNLVQGESVEYFKSGGKKYIAHYTDDKYDGYFQEFYAHGQVKQEGWYQQGDRQQQWIVYYADGTVDSDYYYANGSYSNTAFDYFTDGKLYATTEYESGNVTDIIYYNVKGEAATEKKKEGNGEVFEMKYDNGKLQVRIKIECGNFSENISKWFPDGNVFYTYTMTDGNRNGAYQYNHINSKTSLQGKNVMGSKEGLWEDFYFNGQLDNFGNYEEGELDSTWVYYYPFGTIASSSEYLKGKRNGLTRYYSPDGKLMLEKKYSNGDMLAYRPIVDGTAGAWVPFTADATILVKYGNGKTAFEEHFVKGVLEGVKRLYYPSGQLYSEYHFALGDYTGSYTIFYSNGKLFEKGEYKLDELNGLVELYNEDGSLLLSENHLMGVRQGKSIWYEKGVKVNEFNFWGGMTNE